MKACGLIVEYNPFHNGHQFHLEQAREASQADCMIAVMSGSFLQRGEPAIIDKFHRTKAALMAGVDLVIELPFAYAVQSSHYFATGAVTILNDLKVETICFGSESGKIEPFYHGVSLMQKHKRLYDETIQTYLQKGYSYPRASSKAYEEIGIDDLDLFQPNNILGLSYTKAIVHNQLPIKALTIKRKNSHYHDDEINSSIASATSIRKEITVNELSEQATTALPKSSQVELETYKHTTGVWHTWEDYFPLLYYRVISMSANELATIHGVDEGLETRLKETVKQATSFHDWIRRMKSKRYTHVRLQRMFVHILTNTTKQEIQTFLNRSKLPYIRLLGMNKTGQAYLHQQKKQIETPIITNLTYKYPDLAIDERAQHVYYSILQAETSQTLRNQEFALPIKIDTP